MSDVCLVLEGTYPYVRGGVSAWTHNLIKTLPDVRFSIVSIMPTPADTREELFEIPPNVQSFVNIYLRDYHFPPSILKRRYSKLFDFFELFYHGTGTMESKELEAFLLKLMKNRNKLDLNYAFGSHDFWKSVHKLYAAGDTTISFLDFFWNYRFTFLPLMQVLKAKIPPARLYHTISTGYAGVLATLAKIKFNSNMILTEHGIYTRERRIEIAQASWIYEREQDIVKARSDLGFFKVWWNRYFGVMSRLTYNYADQITTLYDGNKKFQIDDGADPQKIEIIPNGVDLESFKDITDAWDGKTKRRTIAYVGRIVPIKDIKTLIRASRIIVQERPDVQILLIGPQEEESQYYNECSALISIMGLQKNVVFTGYVNLKEYYPRIDMMLLTSISEAQPLVILEAGACGIPFVATDVGACRELLEGKNVEDREIGPSGIICDFRAPNQIARASLKLLEDEDLYQKMAKAGKERVARFYNQKDVLTSYSNLYEQYI